MSGKTKLLMISPPLPESYRNSKVKSVVNSWIPLNLAVLAAGCEKAGAEVRVLDLNISKNPEKDLFDLLTSFEPNFCAISFTTGTVIEMKRITKEIKQFNNKIKLIGGGTHASSLPEQILRDSLLDIIAIGEADYSLPEIVIGKKLSEINGIAFKNANGNIEFTAPATKIKDLDELPFPAWHLFDIKKYRVSKLISRKHPVAPIETSRGCVFSCTYCTKAVFGQRWTFKSVDKTVKEIEHLAEFGFKEFHVFDDLFNTNLPRAKEICRELKKRDLGLTYNLINGIRVNTVDEELADLIIESGGYRASFGVESGNQNVLNYIKKGTTLEQARNAMKITKNAGLERLAYFIFGLPTDTEKTMQETIDFAVEIEPDWAKAAIFTPFPGTPEYDRMIKQGYVVEKNWENFTTHDAKQIFKHPILDYETIEDYYKKFYKSFYFRPKYWVESFVRGVKTGSLPYEVSALFTTGW